MNDHPRRRDTAQEVATDQFALLVESVVDYAIFMLDPEGHVASWNRGAERCKGYTRDEIVGQHFSVFYTEPDRERRHPQHELEIAIEEGRYEEEGWRVRKDGSRFWANVVITTLRRPSGEHVGFAKVTRDLTERRERMQALERSRADLERSNRELQQFVFSAAHDLNEPLRTVSGFVELLSAKHRTELSTEAQQYLGYISSSTSRMQTLIGDLLAYARAGVEELEIVRVDVKAAVARVVASLRALIDERRAEVSLDVSIEACALGDITGIELVLQNLISNAVKFGSADGPHVEVDARRTDEGWRFCVSDNGIGIAADRHETIFEPFRRLHPSDFPGSGLGLAICQRIVGRLGGEIGVESDGGAGSRFWFTLPAPEDAGSEL